MSLLSNLALGLSAGNDRYVKEKPALDKQRKTDALNPVITQAVMSKTQNDMQGAFKALETGYNDPNLSGGDRYQFAKGDDGSILLDADGKATFARYDKDGNELSRGVIGFEDATASLYNRLDPLKAYEDQQAAAKKTAEDLREHQQKIELDAKQIEKALAVAGINANSRLQVAGTNADSRVGVAQILTGGRKDVANITGNFRLEQQELANQGSAAVAGINGQYRVQGIGIQQEGANSRNAATNQTRVATTGMQQEGANSRNAATNQTRLVTTGMQQDGANYRNAATNQTRLVTTGMQQDGANYRAEVGADSRETVAAMRSNPAAGGLFGGAAPQGSSRGASRPAQAAQALVNADPNAVFNGMIRQESGGRHTDRKGRVITSSAGAIGIAQIMPDTAPEAARLAGLPWDPVRYRNDPAYNLASGKAYYQDMLDKFGGDVAKATAAYNAGPGRVQKAVRKAATRGGDWTQYLPAETQDYLVKALQKSGQPAPQVASPQAGAAPAQPTTPAQPTVMTRRIDDKAADSYRKEQSGRFGNKGEFTGAQANGVAGQVVAYLEQAANATDPTVKAKSVQAAYWGAYSIAAASMQKRGKNLTAAQQRQAQQESYATLARLSGTDINSIRAMLGNAGTSQRSAQVTSTANPFGDVSAPAAARPAPTVRQAPVANRPAVRQVALPAQINQGAVRTLGQQFTLTARQRRSEAKLPTINKNIQLAAQNMTQFLSAKTPQARQQYLQAAYGMLYASLIQANYPTAETISPAQAQLAQKLASGYLEKMAGQKPGGIADLMALAGMSALPQMATEGRVSAARQQQINAILNN